MGLSNIENSFLCVVFFFLSFVFNPGFIQDTKVGSLIFLFFFPSGLAKHPLAWALLCHSGLLKLLSQNCLTLTFFLSAAIRKSWQFIQILSLGIYSMPKLRR